MATVSLTSLQGLSARGVVSLDNVEGLLQRIIDQVKCLGENRWGGFRSLL